MGPFLPLLAVLPLVPSTGGATLGPAPDQTACQRGPDARPNLLLVIADDLGVDRIAAYGESPTPGNTPRIDELASQGVLFRNAWSNPGCSPTRATILTGTYALRNGIGRAVGYESEGQYELDLSIPTLPGLLPPAYRTAASGKWHLGVADQSGPLHALYAGFEHHWGFVENPPAELGLVAYWATPKVVDGVFTQPTKYATTDQVDDALAAIDAFGDDPWLVWLAFTAAHGPFHKPPHDLHTLQLPPTVQEDYTAHSKAMSEAMDTELGRLLDRLAPDVRARTYVVFVGDNGTTGSVIDPPYPASHAKGTVFEPGINVPLIVAGPGVAKGAECEALVNTTDLFATALELLGGSPSATPDSISLAPYLADPAAPSARAWAYAEAFGPNGFGPKLFWRRTVRNLESFKLIRFVTDDTLEREELYDLRADPLELDDLMSHPEGLTPFQQEQYDELLAVLNGIA